MELSETWNKGIAQKALENLNPVWSTISITQNQDFEDEHRGDVCLSWGRWGEFVGGRVSGGDGLESRGSGVMGMAGKAGWDEQWYLFKHGRDEAGLGFLQS
nr:hypothetical protein [Tanacetum cinerariifolium]